VGLNPGTRLGAYEIASLLGKGGMGEVYRARDERLGRDVALKVLPDVFAADPDRIARFEREARVLASLTHTNIGAIHGLEEGALDDGSTVRALVLELVEGETLADRIARGPLPLDDALPVARQIAEALEAAHEQGIVHRDLKPANIKLTPNGAVKVLDFGLARLAVGSPPSSGSPGVTTDPLAALSMSPTIAMPGGTAVGIVLGTAAYMSPEQAKGRPADKRSDMWAFGCVLYEMLTGKPTFEGDDVSEILAEVIKSHVTWESLPANTPPALQRLLRRCLVKDLKSRIADAGVARLEIDEAASQPETTSRPADAKSVVAPSARQRWGMLGAGLVLGAAIVAAAALVLPRRDSARALPATRFGISLPPSVRLAGNASQRLAISRDGRRVVYVAVGSGIERLYVHALDRLEPTAVAGVEGDLGSLFLSPDGEWVGYNDPRAGKFKKVRITGGPPATICDVPNAAGGFTGASWGSTGTIVFSTANNGSLMQAPEAGGAFRPLTKPAGDERHRHPFFLPDGKALLFTISKPGQPDQIAVLKLDTGVSKVLTQGSSPRYSPTGHVIFLRENALWAQAFDAVTLVASGDAVPVLEGVGRQGSVALFDIAANGTMVYAPFSSDTGSLSLVWVDRSGHEEALAAPPRAYADVQLSPDGTRLALSARDQENDIWIWHLMRKTLTRLTFDRGIDGAPFWTPDGRRIVFASDRDGGVPHLFWQLADGTGVVERLTGGNFFQLVSSVSHDGRVAVFEQREGPPDLFAVALSAPASDQAQKPAAREIRPLVKTTFIDRNGTISPDGRWLAYESNSSGDFEVFVRPYPDTDGGQWQVSTSGGTKPLWARDSSELFFVGDGALMRVHVERGSTWTAGVPEVVVKGPYAFEVSHPVDVSADGKRFIMLKQEGRPSQPSGPAIVLTENWTEELKRLVKPAGR
jgi:serine/threonine-protein kinase